MSRFPPLDPATLDADQRAVYERIASGARGGVGGPFSVLLQSPELASRVEQLGVFIRYECGVPQRLRELAILVVGAHWKAEYEWYAHAGIALTQGLSAGVIEAVGQDRQPAFETKADQAVFGFARELLRMGRVSDEAFLPVKELLGDKGVVELTGLIGYYTLLAFQLNTFQVEPPSGGPAIPWARNQGVDESAFADHEDNAMK